jgi:hypothetical protein
MAPRHPASDLACLCRCHRRSPGTPTPACRRAAAPRRAPSCEGPSWRPEAGAACRVLARAAADGPPGHLCNAVLTCPRPPLQAHRQPSLTPASRQPRLLLRAPGGALPPAPPAPNPRAPPQHTHAQGPGWPGGAAAGHPRRLDHRHAAAAAVRPPGASAPPRGGRTLSACQGRRCRQRLPCAQPSACDPAAGQLLGMGPLPLQSQPLTAWVVPPAPQLQPPGSRPPAAAAPPPLRRPPPALRADDLALGANTPQLPPGALVANPSDFRPPALATKAAETSSGGLNQTYLLIGGRRVGSPAAARTLGLRRAPRRRGRRLCRALAARCCCCCCQSGWHMWRQQQRRCSRRQ